MRRSIDAEDVEKRIDIVMGSEPKAWDKKALRELKMYVVHAVPTADVVEVVRCKDCRHFEYDHSYIIQGIPVLGHEVCNAWGDGCKTDENGYCFMAERRTDE